MSIGIYDWHLENPELSPFIVLSETHITRLIKIAVSI